MSTLTSSSTLAVVQSAYDDNASYYEDDDATKAKAFITACRILLRRIPRDGMLQGARVTLTPEIIQDQLNAAVEWLAGGSSDEETDSLAAGDIPSSGPRVSRANFNNFRG